MTPGRSCDGQKSVFQSILRHQNFRVPYRQTDLPTYQGTHPLIESLRQRLKSTELQLTFIARLPLLGEKSFVMVNGVEEIVFVVNEDELNGLLIEYLM